MKPVDIKKNKQASSSKSGMKNTHSYSYNYNLDIKSESCNAECGVAALASTDQDETASLGGLEIDAVCSQDSPDQADASRYSNVSKSSKNKHSSSNLLLPINIPEIPSCINRIENGEANKSDLTQNHQHSSVSSSTEIASTSCGTTTATFEISSSSTISSPLSSDEENEKDEKSNLKHSLKCIEKFNKNYDGQVEDIADQAAELTAHGSFFDCGLYQFISFMFLSIVWTIGNGWYAYVSVFSGYTPSFQCDMGVNFTVNENDTECSAIDAYTSKTVKCEKWSYDKSQMHSTIITDHNFVCEKNFYFELGYSIEQIGYIVGTLIFSYIADIIGRKPVLVGTLVSMCGLGFLQYLFINSFVTYIAFGFVINSLACGLEAVCVTLVLEMFTTSKRTIFGIGIEVVWVIVLAAMAPLAYAIKAWKEIRLVIFALLAVLTVVSPWLAQESVRWLISMGKLEKAVKIIDKLVKYNKLDKSKSKRNKLNQMFADLSLYNKMLEKQTKNNALSKESKSIDSNQLTERASTSILNIFINGKFRIYVFIMALNWFATALVYDGLTYLNNFIGENIFFNWIAMNLIELPAQFVCYYVISRYGRRLTVSVTLILAGFTLLLTLVDLIEFFEKITWLKLVLFVIAKFILTQSYSAVILHAPELFPTNLRSFGYGICLFSGKITSIMSPMISLYLSKIAPRLPAVIYGTISIVCGILSLYVPETLNRPLPNSIDDVCRWPRDLTSDEWRIVKEINHNEFNIEKIRKKLFQKKDSKEKHHSKKSSNKFSQLIGFKRNESANTESFILQTTIQKESNTSLIESRDKHSRVINSELSSSNFSIDSSSKFQSKSVPGTPFACKNITLASKNSKSSLEILVK